MSPLSGGDLTGTHITLCIFGAAEFKYDGQRYALLPLSTQLSNCQPHPTTHTHPACTAEYKYDGQRAQIHLTADGQVSFGETEGRSRGGGRAGEAEGRFGAAAWPGRTAPLTQPPSSLWPTVHAALHTYLLCTCRFASSAAIARTRASSSLTWRSRCWQQRKVGTRAGMTLFACLLLAVGCWQRSKIVTPVGGWQRQQGWGCGCGE